MASRITRAEFEVFFLNNKEALQFYWLANIAIQQSVSSREENQRVVFCRRGGKMCSRDQARCAIGQEKGLTIGRLVKGSLDSAPDIFTRVSVIYLTASRSPRARWFKEHGCRVQISGGEIMDIRWDFFQSSCLSGRLWSCLVAGPAPCASYIRALV